MEGMSITKADSIKQMFRKFDAGGRGTLHRDQLCELLKRVSGFHENDFNSLLGTNNGSEDEEFIDYDAFVDFLSGQENIPFIEKQATLDQSMGLAAALLSCSDKVSVIQTSKMDNVISQIMANPLHSKNLSLLASQILKEKETREANCDHELRLRKLFDDCDIDGSGDMSVEELALALDREKDMAEEFGWHAIAQETQLTDIVKVFQEADTDNSGHLSWEEFFQIMKCYRKQHNKEDAEQRAQSAAESIQVVLQRRKKGRKKTLSGVSIQWWIVDYWNLSEDDEFAMLRQAMNSWEIESQLEVDLTMLRKFLHAVKMSYRDVSYHNFQHAIATLHYVFKLVEGAGMGAALSKEQLFALLIAAICHDCDHRGRNTHFEVATRSILALRYNDKSPLENHHCATAFQLAFSGDDACNIFKGLNSEAFRKVRHNMVDGILATDMHFHNDHVKKLHHISNVAELLENSDFIVELLLHTADIGSPLMRVDISQKFARLIHEEFTQQVEEEASLGLPVTAMMSGLQDEQMAAKSRIGFIDFVVQPLVTPLFDLFPEWGVPRECLEENLTECKKQLL